MCMRSSDSEDKLRFRSDRILCLNGLFYFNTREGTQEGPYRSREQAEVAAALYIRYHLDPTRLDSAQHAPDPHFHRYAERSLDDRRQGDRRQHERRQGDRRQHEEPPADEV